MLVDSHFFMRVLLEKLLTGKKSFISFFNCF